MEGAGGEGKANEDRCTSSKDVFSEMSEGKSFSFSLFFSKSPRTAVMERAGFLPGENFVHSAPFFFFK